MFHRAYSEGTAPWDIGRPQPEIVALAEAGTFGHRVVDLGCGTGEQTLMLAARGYELVGIDAVPEAIKRARRKAGERGIAAQFIDGDLFEVLPLLGRSFDSVVDVGLFHAFSDEDRVRFAAALGRVLVPGGVYAMLCFSDVQQTGEMRASPDWISTRTAKGACSSSCFRSCPSLIPGETRSTRVPWYRILQRSSGALQRP